jgi:Ca2+-binding EF-hand superfamily protein
MLEDHRFFATEKEVGYLMDRFDKNRDGLVSYREFIKEMSPQAY